MNAAQRREKILQQLHGASAPISASALAAKLGVSRQAVSKWERAESSPDTDNLLALARLYGVSLDALLPFDGEACRRAAAPSFRLSSEI